MKKLIFLIFFFYSICGYTANPDDLAKLSKSDTQKGLDLSNADLRSYQFPADKINLKKMLTYHTRISVMLI